MATAFTFTFVCRSGAKRTARSLAIHCYTSSVDLNFLLSQKNMTMSAPTVLVVEDEPDVLMIAAFILEDAGYCVLEAAGADEALSLLTRHRDIDLVFSDIQMAGSMNGIDLAQYVHKKQEDLPILLTSANARAHYDNYPDDTPFLCKPYDRQTLLKMIASAIHAS